MTETLKYGIIGAGKVGLSIAELLFDEGKLAFIFDIDIENIPSKYNGLAFSSLCDLPETQFIYIAIADTALATLAEDLALNYPFATQSIFAHSSGVKSANSLSALSQLSRGVAAIHPFQTFAYADKSNLKDVQWGVECSDVIYAECVRFVEVLGGGHCRLRLDDAMQKALYHCSAVMSSNNMTTSLQSGKLIAEKAGIPPTEFIAPITRKTLENNITAFADSHIPLTGPIARADAAAVSQHIIALEDPQLIRIYCYSSLATLELSLMTNLVNKEDYLRIKKVLETALQSSL